MAKQGFTKKQVISIVGLLEKNDEDKYIVSVEGKDTFKEYDLAEILEQMEGSVISLTSDIF